jgi:hypothetical protein
LALPFLTTFLFCFSLFACTDKKVDALLKERYVKWIDENAAVQFSILDAKGVGYGTVTVKGDKKEAWFYLNNDKFGFRLEIVLLNRANPLGESDSDYFSIRYKDGKIQSYEESVTLFGEKYDRLVFSRGEVDKDAIDASDYLCVNWMDYWADYRNNLTISVGYDDRKYGMGKAKVGAELRLDILFIWKPDKAFAIYIDKRPDKFDGPVAEGTYTNEQKVLTLTFTADGLFNGRFPIMELHGWPAPF